jgi:ankyrin repeat domain-containing protein 50
MVKRIDDQQDYMKELALNCFMWIFYARRPLNTQELQHALATNSACKRQTDIEVDKVEVILEACGNLLVEENNAIRPVHYSVQEFFMNPPGEIARRHILERIADSNSMHTELSRVCLRYIQLGALNRPCEYDFRLHFRIQDAPFACYAAQCFDYHVLHCKTLPEDILQLIEELLNRDGEFLAAILQIRNIRDGFNYDSLSRDFDQITFVVSASTIIYGTYLFDVSHLQTHWVGLTPPRYALHHASSAGLLNVVNRLVEQGCDIDERDRRSASPIYYASDRGHDKVVELLLSKGADVNAQGGYYGNALQAASERGHDKIVELLLGQGADINAQGGHYGNALQAASS